MLTINYIFVVIFINQICVNGLKWKEKYDYVIVGGGTAGCILARRLSEDPKTSVLLLEAGKDDSSDPFALNPKTWLFMATNPAFNWPFMSEAQPSIKDRNVNLPAGKTLGGSSSINAMFLIRGSRYDYDKWEAMGNKGWGWDDVLPYFKKAEAMQTEALADNGYHGSEGPMETKSAQDNDLKLADELLNAAEELGLSKSYDINSGIQGDIGYTQLAIDSKGHRSNTYVAFLKPVLARWNLDVVTEAYVTKIKIRKSVAKGVHFMKNNTKYFVKAKKEVIVSAGTMNSAKLLMLSGIGPKDHLKENQIKVVADLPVGNTMIEHPALRSVLGFNTNQTVQNPFKFEELFEYIFTGKGLWSINNAQYAIFLRSHRQPAKEKYPYLEVLTQISLPNVLFPVSQIIRSGGQVPQQFYDLMKLSANAPLSGSCSPHHLHLRTSGTVRLRSNDSFDNPKITLNWFVDDNDVKDFISSIRFIQSFIQTSPMKGIQATDNHQKIPECLLFEFDSDDYWECVIRKVAAPAAHYTTSCRMGKDGVVDENLRVRGINKLRVVDASIIPVSVSGHTMAATIMVAEKGADIIKGIKSV